MEDANRGAVLHRARELRVEPLPMPVPGPHEVLVRLSVVGICGSDVHFYEHGGIGPFEVREPLVMGHEPCGVVMAQGTGAFKHAAGTRVVIEPQRPCGRCEQCRSGRYNLCPDVDFFANPPADPSRRPTQGALASYVTVDEDFAYPVPDALDDESAALIEPLAVVLHALRRVQVGPGASVLVTGAGPIGLLALQTAIASGATDVTVADVRGPALDHASRLGATRVVNTARSSLLDLDVSSDVFVECSGNPAAMSDGIMTLRPFGRAVLVGVGPETADLPVARIRRRELSVTATFRYAGVFPDAIALASTGRVDLKSLITDRYSLDQAPRAFEDAVRRRASQENTSIKSIVDLRRDGGARATRSSEENQ